MIDYDFSITSHCNAACPSCKRYDNHESEIYDPNEPLHAGLNQIHMRFSDFQFVLQRDMNSFKDKTVTFEGELGDPMVNPEVKRFIDYGCKIFKKLIVVTNGGNRKSSFYRELGNTHKNLEMFFSIDGLYDDTNQRYRKKVDTKRAIENMISFRTSKHGKNNVIWQFLVFQHNFFEIPEILQFSEKHDIQINIKINTRPKFRIKNKLIPHVIEMYEKNAFEMSHLYLAN